MHFDQNREENIDNKETIYASVEQAVIYTDNHDLNVTQHIFVEIPSAYLF